MFTRHVSHGEEGDECVIVDWETDERVSVALERMSARRGESRNLVLVVVAGDIVRPENATPLIENFLMQIAGPTTLRHRVLLALRPSSY